MISGKLFTLFVVCNVVLAKLEPRLWSKQHPLKDLVNFAVRAYHHYCYQCRATLLIHDEDDKRSSNYFLRKISKNDFNMSLISISLSYDENPWTLAGTYTGDYIEMTIIFWTKRFYKKVNEFLDIVGNFPYWNRYSKIVILAEDDVPEDYVEWMKEIFPLFWKRKILRVFLAFIYNNKRQIYMYYPFNNSYGINITDLSDEEYTGYFEYELLDLYGYPMKVFNYDRLSYSERVLTGPYNKQYKPTWLGFDGKFMTETRDILNVTMEIYKESETKLFEKFIRYLDEDQVTVKNFMNFYDLDVFFTAIRAQKKQEVDLIFLQERDDLCFVVPKGKPVPQYLYIFLIIPLPLWIGTTSCFITIAFCFWFLKRNCPLLDTYRIIFNIPLVDITKPTSNPTRIIIHSWVSYAFIFSIVFQCTLMSTLVHPKFYPDIEKVEELAHLNITIYAGSRDYELIAENYPNPKLLSKFQTKRDWTVELMTKQSDGENGFLVRSEIARAFLKEMSRIKEGRPVYHIMAEHPIPSISSYIMPKNHPYLEEMIWNVNKVHESGLYFIWRATDYGYTERIVNSTKRRNYKLSQEKETGKFVQLTLQHIQTAFYILGIGILCGSIVFVIEIMSLHYPKLKLHLFH